MPMTNEETGLLPASPVPAAPRLPPLPVLVIEPTSGWVPLPVSEMWRYRELLVFLLWRDVMVRYKQTALGAAWAILQPLLMMVVFSVFLGKVAGVSSGHLPYPVFLYAGLLPWTFFATAVGNAADSIISSERLITKVYFPRLLVPFAAVGAAVVDFTIAFGFLGVLMLFYGVMPGAGLLLLPLLALLLLLAALGIGTLLAALNVAYRDFRYVLPFTLQLWLFATPTVYLPWPPTPGEGPGGNLAPVARWLVELNPLTGIIGAFRGALLGTPVAWGAVAVAAVLSGLVFVAGCLYFRRMERFFADVL